MNYAIILQSFFISWQVALCQTLTIFQCFISLSAGQRRGAVTRNTSWCFIATMTALPWPWSKQPLTSWVNIITVRLWDELCGLTKQQSAAAAAAAAWLLLLKQNWWLAGPQHLIDPTNRAYPTVLPTSSTNRACLLREKRFPEWLDWWGNTNTHALQLC